jgi:hypothetical protein
LGYPLQRADEIGAQEGEVSLYSRRPADHDMVGAGVAVDRQHFPRQRSEAPLHAVADDSPANFLGDGEADPHERVIVAPVADQQDESGSCRALASVRGEEIRPFA